MSWQFNRKGVVLVPTVRDGGEAISEDDLMLVALDHGAEDITDAGTSWQVTTPPNEVEAVRAALAEAGFPIESAEATMVADNLVPLDNETDAKKVLRLIDLLEEHDDVQNVYANFDIPDAIIELIEA